MTKALPGVVKDFVSRAPVCRIATVRPNGEPHVIPVCPAFAGESTVYVDIAKQGVSASAFSSNAAVTALFDEYHDDWSKLQAVVLRCRAEALRGAELDLAWEMLRAKFPQGESIGWSPRLTLALRVRSWSEWGLIAALSYEPE